MPGVPIIDCLFSLDLIEHSDPPQSPSEQAKTLVRDMDRSAIGHVLLSPCRRWRCADHWQPDGISLAEVTKLEHEQPSRFSVLASYNPYAIPESLARIDSAVRAGARGVFLQTEGSDVRLADTRMYPLYARCRQLGIPLVVQVGVSMSNIARVDELSIVAGDSPELRVIAGICGPIDLSAVIKLCDHAPNVSFAFDGALVCPGDVTLFRNSAIARDRAMFGSNGCRWVDLIEGFARLELSFDAMRAFLCDNASRIFRIDTTVGSVRERRVVALA